MRKITGAVVSTGITKGKAFVRDSHVHNSVLRYIIEEQHIDAEIARLELAIDTAHNSLDILRNEYKSGKNDIDSILESQQFMLKDIEFLRAIELRLRESRYNVEWVLQEYINSLVYKISDIQDDYLSDRSIDLYDIMRRIFDALSGTIDHSLSEPSVLVCYNLMPTELLSLPRKYILGIAMEGGGLTSHTAILANSLDIPCIMHAENVTLKCHDDDFVILDAAKGIIIIDPDKETLETYDGIIEEYKSHVLAAETRSLSPAKTADGTAITVLANVRVAEEVSHAAKLSPEGIGLYCSEFLYLQSEIFSNEEEQYHAYRDVLKTFDRSEVVIRTLDIGGDKLSHSINEQNPMLGLRSVRFSFKHIDLFNVQLRALLRASVYGNLSILFPLISTVGEIDAIKKRIEMIKSDLSAQNIPYADSIPIGVMIEVPAAVMLAEELAQVVDFFSIGTNDLVQYTMAVDRTNEYVSYLYSEYDPAVLRMLKKSIDATVHTDCSVTICGEMAHDAQATAILLGMGLRRFSVQSRDIADLKYRTSQLHINDCKKLADSVLSLSRKDEIIDCINKFRAKQEKDSVTNNSNSRQT